MTLVSPPQSAPNDEITADAINDPVNAIAAVVNGQIDDTNVSGLSGSKIANSTITYTKLDFPLSLGYAQTTSTFTTANITATQVTGLSTTVTIPAGARRIKITGFSYDVGTNTGAATVNFSIWDGVVGVGTQLAANRITTKAAGSLQLNIVMAVVTPAAGSKTYNLALQTDNGANSAFIEASATAPAFILVEAM